MASTDITEQFEEDMAEADFDVRHYHGRSFWHGPAVETDDLQRAIRATTVRVQWDAMGRDGYIVYPVAAETEYESCKR